MKKVFLTICSMMIFIVSTFVSYAQQRKRPDPVYIDATENILVRSFIDLPVGGRVTHSVNVGSPTTVHYTYDMDKGAIVVVWRGDFLNASSMWIERGDGSSRVRGKATYFGKPALTLAKLSSDQATWIADTAGTGYKPKGYKLDDAGLPTFMYQLNGAKISDASKVLANGEGIQRQVTAQSATTGMYARLAAGKQIIKLSDSLFSINDKAYQIRLDDSQAKPIIRTLADGQELLVPFQSKLTYSIIF
ncbi:hypothetical protein [Mucilaginibacter sp. HD30]